MRLLPMLALSLLLLVAASTSQAVVFVVDSTADTSDVALADDLCDDGTGACSLRAAIEQANATIGADRIHFSIPGPVPHMIPIGIAPTITGSLVIDGTTQPGSSVNTAAVGTNAVWGVILTGIEFVEEVSIRVEAPASELRGLWITEFSRPGGFATPCVQFGPDTSGSRFRGNRVEFCAGEGVLLVEGDRLRIGDSALASRNLFRESTLGLIVTGDANFIVNNLIGTDASGTLPSGTGTGIELAGNGNTVTDNTIVAGGHGVWISGDGNTLLRNRIGGLTTFDLGSSVGVLISGSANEIGRPSLGLAQANGIFGNDLGVLITNPGGGNFVRGNRFGGAGLANGGAIQISGSSGNTISENEIGLNVAGVSVVEANGPTIAAIDNRILANRIWANTQYDLRLGTGTPHDDGQVGFIPDADEGPNHLQNPPHITSASLSQGSTTITGNIDAAPGRYTLEFFSNSFCSVGARGGEFYLGSATLDATGTITNPRTNFSYTLPVTAQGRGITGTATDADGNTSEFSACYTAAVFGGADLVLTGSVSPFAPFARNPGDVVQYSLRLENRGPFSATDIPVVVSSPAGFLSSWSARPGFNVAASIWRVSNLAVGAAVQLELEATVLPTAAGPFRVTARAESGLSQLDPNSTNNAANFDGFVRSGADLVVSQIAPVSGEDGELVSFDVTVRNSGPEDAASVTVSGELDAGLVFEGASFFPPQFSHDAATRRWTWAAGDLPDQASMSLRVDARVAASLAPDPNLQHTVRAFAASPSDPPPTLSTKVVGLGVAADLELKFECDLLVGGSLGDPGCVANVTNLGPKSVGSSILRFSSGEGRFFVRPGDRFSEWTCTSSEVGDSISCLIGALRSGGVGTQIFFELSPESPRVEMVTASLEIDPNVPYYDINQLNNYTIWFSPMSHLYQCGLIGIEFPIFVGLFAWLRGGKRRAAFRRVFSGAAVILALMLVGSTQTAHATPVTFTIDSSASNATVSVTSELGSPPPVGVALSGILETEITLGIEPPFGLVATSLQLAGGSIALADFSVLLSNVGLYELAFASSGVAGAITGPTVSGFSVGPGHALFEIGGSTLRFGAGSIAASGEYFGFPVDSTIGLATTPLLSRFPFGSTAELRVTDLGAGMTDLRLSLPFSALVRLVIDDSEPVDITIAGTLVATGQTVVPEPGTATLLGLGLMGLGVRRGRRVSE